MTEIRLTAAIKKRSVRPDTQIRPSTLQIFFELPTELKDTGVQGSNHLLRNRPGADHGGRKDQDILERALSAFIRKQASRKALGLVKGALAASAYGKMEKCPMVPHKSPQHAGSHDMHPRDSLYLTSI
jgi:hypothetical protein